MSGDTISAGYLPFSIIYYQDLFLEHFYNNPQLVSNAYAFITVNGHLMSIFPIVTPVLITPFVYVCTLGMTPGHAFLHIAQIVRTTSAGIAALAVCTFYLVVIRFVPRKIAILSTLVFAFATSTWSIGSQALWQHGMVELLLLLILYAIIRNEENPSPIWFIIAGILSGLLVFCRPPDALLIIPVLGYVFWKNRTQSIYYLVPAILSGLPFLAYNWYFFGTISGGYIQNLGRFGLSPEVLANFAGLFLSPNKGLFVFSPVLILAVFGYFRSGSIGNRNLSLLLRWFGPVLILETAMYAFFYDWGGGYAYGPRFLTSLVPVLCIYVALFLSYTAALFRAGMYDYLKAGAIAFLVVVSVAIQFIGVFYFPYLDDSHYPQPWDSSNPLIASSLQDGVEQLDTFAVQSIPPFPPLYYYTRYDEWKYLNVKAALSAGDYSTAALYYIQYLQENPDSYILWNNLGCCQIKLGEYDEAIQSFDRSLAINPQFKDAQLNRAAAVQILARGNRSVEIGITVLTLPGKAGSAG
ncbi:MAG: tetratricopeptide repeat protein [Methanoregula sp.]|uniref:tetratricopeptide repeat protein n=1 Tax=Methanoregula sp. TaxID=2052170 RepID=UPI0025F18CC2|nr:tetratricopeptide repeat protein [Methanoregula sp.]MCK9630605.1 tetratricopeptide repeat protein [Methanoregula sp.]